MKKSLLFLFLLISSFDYAQEQKRLYIFYGCPPTCEKLVIGDKIIMNIPTERDGRFQKYEDFDTLIAVLKSNEKYKFKIEIHFFWGTSRLSLSISNSLANSLKGIIELKSKVNNFEIVGMGATNPIFLKASDPDYRKLNTRIEIKVSN